MPKRRIKPTISTRGKTEREFFEERYVINEKTGCWEWIGDTRRKGYGVYKFKNGRYTAHRSALRLYKRKDVSNKELHASHLCRNVKCVNPNHIRLVPPEVNQAHKQKHWEKFMKENPKLFRTASSRAIQRKYRDWCGLIDG